MIDARCIQIQMSSFQAVKAQALKTDLVQGSDSLNGQFGVLGRIGSPARYDALYRVQRRSKGSDIPSQLVFLVAEESLVCMTLSFVSLTRRQ